MFYTTLGHAGIMSDVKDTIKTEMGSITKSFKEELIGEVATQVTKCMTKYMEDFKSDIGSLPSIKLTGDQCLEKVRLHTFCYIRM